MSVDLPAARIRWLLAALVVAVATGGLFSLIYATDAALSIIERVQRLPLWLGVLSTSFVIALAISTVWLLWRILRPRRSQLRSAVPPKIDRASVERRLEALPAAAPSLHGEIAELDRRAVLGRLFVALFGDVSAGKSSLIAALVPQADVRIDVRAGTTRDVRNFEGDLGDGLILMLADVPGTGEWQGEARAVAAREEALRAHAVVYVCEGDLTRTQFDEIAWLRAFGKPLLLVLNKTDRYQARELDALRQRLRERTGLVPLAVSAGGSERVRVIAANGDEVERERARPPQIERLLEALRKIARLGPASFESGRERAVLGALDLKISELEAEQRQRQAATLVREYARKAALGAMAAVAPGTDLVIQGVLATRLLTELARLYEVPLRSIDLDSFVQLAGGRLRGTSALILAIAGNALKAFPGLGTVGGGLVHAVAYAMIFDSLGRAVAETLARGEGFDRLHALERLDATLKDSSGLLARAPELLKLALQARESTHADP